MSKLRTTKAAVLATSLVFLFLFLLFIYQKKNHTDYKLISSDNFRVILLSFDYSNSTLNHLLCFPKQFLTQGYTVFALSMKQFKLILN